jgi:hypothetical protein
LQRRRKLTLLVRAAVLLVETGTVLERPMGRACSWVVGADDDAEVGKDAGRHLLMLVLIFYTSIVQSTLLYEAETWDATEKVLKALAGFHHRVARRLSGRTLRYLCRTDEWVYPPNDEALAATGMATTIKSTVTARQESLLVERIATRPILEICREEERLPGVENT